VILGLALAAALPVSRYEPALAAPIEQKISVGIDEAKLISLPKGLNRIILGNPIIVGITPLPGGGAVLTGKAYGETNLIVLDDRGGIVVEATIRVAMPANPDVVVQRDQQRATYGCGGNCQLRMQLGDASEVAQGAASQIQSRNSLATTGAVPQAPAPAAVPGPKGQSKL
jgi:hypothetical protein